MWEVSEAVVRVGSGESKGERTFFGGVCFEIWDLVVGVECFEIVVGVVIVEAGDEHGAELRGQKDG